MNYETEVAQERPLSEGDQIKVAIRELFCESRAGTVYTKENPLRRRIKGVNGSAEKYLCLFKSSEIKGAVTMWYEDVE